MIIYKVTNKLSVLQVDKITNEIINEYPSMQEAQRQTNISVQNIHKCIHGKIKSAGGFKWKRKV